MKYALLALTDSVCATKKGGQMMAALFQFLGDFSRQFIVNDLLKNV